MAIFNKISFPSHVGLPWEEAPPTVDGFTELHPGVPLSRWQLEAGYVGSPKFDYAGSGVAFPIATFAGVKHQTDPFLYMSFDIRFDPTFNDSDRVMILIRPSFLPQTNSANDRRIDILPVQSGSAGVGGGAMAAPASANDDAGTNYRTNRPARTYEIYKRNSGVGGPWTNITPGVTNVEVRVSSSEPIVAPAPSGAKHWTVELKIPTTTGAGLGGGADWINISNDFGLYVNVLRICSGASCSGPEIGGFFSTQFTWPFDPGNPLANVLTDSAMGGAQPPEDWDVSPMTLGQAFILAPGALNPAQGVKFQNGYLGIGVLSRGSVGGTLDMKNVGTSNKLVARLVNDHPANDAAAGIRAEFRIADFWGLGPYGNGASWRKTPAVPGPNPAASTALVPHASASTVDIISEWITRPEDVTHYDPLWYDQCIWVDLNAPAGAFLAESSVRRNLTVLQASEVEGAAGVSGEVPDADDNGSGEIDYWLHSAAVRLPTIDYSGGAREGELRGMVDVHVNANDDRDRQNTFEALGISPLLSGQTAESYKESATFLVVDTGYWRTPEILTIDGNAHAIWMNAGSFGSVVHHELETGQTIDDIGIISDISGAGVISTGDGGFSFRVPLKGTKRLWTRVRAGTRDELERPFEPRNEDPPEPKQGDEPGPGDGGGGGGGTCSIRTAAALAIIGVILVTVRRLRR